MTLASKTLTIAGFAIAIAMPSFAQEASDTSSSTSCETFLTLDSTAKAEAVVGARENSTTDEGAAMTDPSADLAEGVEPPANGTDGMPSSAPADGTGTDNLVETDTTEAAPENGTDGMASSEPANPPVPEGTMPATTAELSTEELVALAETSCQTQADASLSDVLSAMP